MKVSKRRQGQVVRTTASSHKAMIAFDAALNAYLMAQEAANYSKASIDDYKRVVGLFIRYISETHSYTCIQQVTEHDMFEWLAHLRNTNSRLGRPYSSRSIETYYTDVHAFFHWLVQHKYLESSPMTQVKLPKIDKPLIRVFTDDELVRLDAACDRQSHGKSLTPDERKALGARDRAVLWLLLSTGMRLSELCRLRFCDIDWKQGMVYVFGKGSKERKIPFGKVARQHLNTYLQYWRGEPTEQDEPVFINVFGKPLRRNSVQALFARLGRIADINDKRVSAHTCRHWFAVNCIKKGMPSTVLQGLLGHEELEMINVYVHLAEQDNRELYAKFSPVDTLEMHHSIKGKREQAREWRNARKRKN